MLYLVYDVVYLWLKSISELKVVYEYVPFRLHAKEREDDA